MEAGVVWGLIAKRVVDLVFQFVFVVVCHRFRLLAMRLLRGDSGLDASNARAVAHEGRSLLTRGADFRFRHGQGLLAALALVVAFLAIGTCFDERILHARPLTMAAFLW
eukprot:CAMPEP_0194773014 /NCGR_PEP_ID=MMETSP0323_2-20130528/53617_1 /TAXON_ID=2866 ORGANISM="Crypthecodinium cohnii, Strain Seligo" /NCGR_SAMPLE_ID=MMETSP0323_2 /ASSEMBLY_ACC=CAM_ASM_000346 /LENGTH=108 /DNA_ID=CAMNT_0039707821 /DNA_START=203 /DNA_END=529 /DNA_ORIENTATION=-